MTNQLVRFREVISQALGEVYERRVYGRLNSVARRGLRSISRVNRRPLFVLGNQKSGTSAIARLLARATKRSSTIDIPGIREPAQHDIHTGMRTFEQFVLENRYDFSKEIVKEPCLTFLYPMLHQEFPEADFLFVQRDPRDNIRAILNRLGIHGDERDLADSSWDELSEDWRKVLRVDWLGLSNGSYIQSLTCRWNLASDVYLNNSHMKLVRYEDFMADKISTIERLAAELGWRVKADISSIADVQFQPAGKDRRPLRDFFGDNLDVIERACAERMQLFGYETGRQ